MTSTVPAVTPVPGLGSASVTPGLLTDLGWRDEESCAGTSLMVDHHFERIVTHDGQVEIMPLSDAVVTYPWVQQLMFSLIDPLSDDVLRRAFESQDRPLGTFTWVHDGAILDGPLQNFSFMTVPQERQFVHDLTVIGAGARVDHISGSGVTPKMTHGRHVSVSETFIGEGARLRSLDVERWGSQMDVHSWSGTRIARDAVNSSVSVAVSGLRNHVAHSTVELDDGATDTSHSVVFAPADTHREMRTEIRLLGAGSRAEQVSRMVSDGGEISNDTTLVGVGRGCSGFLECDGLMLRDTGYIDSVPALKARVDEAQLSHEASVGMIDGDRLDYLMALGLDEDTARDLIVRGFLDLTEQSVPDSLRATVEGLVTAAREAEL
ncbi:SufD family Fe-S cluster assembly protein [Corynebacterium sp. CCM 9185]|uniref:SufD family Fe-S cluster assembly protein n=1 Tax=Corynebacterium marambiense TaxID=2765364 RepID=A0ABS0VUJ2_9CORY|nr:SufD family Fe-S cluster assembly protein [Corynebacterium marambiense]MBI9000449.1 SufD family Fe-S cluster assembly protein [Corynebacterium marambiense]MCK7664202.1 SufD family Fe-S cluster assembly protein [Corynebacterium marambiense]MCX7543490.1 SufD family Fe-S cluster assembly protein [Corynebacterium marambiense]